MKALIAWLDRLATVTPEDGLVEHLFRVVVPGLEPLDVANWLLSIDPQGPLRNDLRASSPESASSRVGIGRRHLSATHERNDEDEDTKRGLGETEAALDVTAVRRP